jgi:hypothetical protein
MSRSEAYRMIRRRAIEAGIFPRFASFLPSHRDHGLSGEQGNAGDSPEDCGAREPAHDEAVWHKCFREKIAVLKT